MTPNLIQIVTVELDDDGMIVNFSDGTTAGYIVEEFLELRPFREPTQVKAQVLIRLNEAVAAALQEPRKFNPVETRLTSVRISQ